MMRLHGEFGSYWRIVAACFVGLVLSASPAYLSSFGLFLTGFVDRYHWTRGQASLALACAGATVAVLTPLVGWLIDRRGVRPILLVGCALFPLTLMAYAFVPMSYPVYLMLAVACGAACSIVGPAIYLNLPPQYFVKNLGLAVGIVVLGLGFGQMIMPLIIQQFIAHFGFDGAWIALGLLVGVIGLTNALFFIHDNPGYTQARAAPDASLDGMTFAEVLRDPLFWLLTIAFALLVPVMAAMMLHLPAILVDRGFTPTAGALAVSLMGLGSILARLLTGVMLDRMPPSLPAGLFFSGQVAGTLLLFAGFGGVTPFVAALLIGSSYGAEGDMMPVVLRRAFGMRAFGRIYGFGFAFLQLGGFCGVLLAGAMFDAYKSYDHILIVFSLIGALATVMVLIACRFLARRSAPAADTDVSVGMSPMPVPSPAE